MQERSEMQQRQGYQAVEKLRETLDEKYLWEERCRSKTANLYRGFLLTEALNHPAQREFRLFWRHQMMMRMDS